MGADGAPGAMLPDGHFVFLAEFAGSSFGSTLFDYNYNTNTLTDLTSTLPSQLQDELFFSASSDCRMLVVTDGGLLLNTGFNTIWEYKTSIAPQAAWRPTVTTVSKITPGRYQISGARLNGISEGATFGSDARMSTNFPIVQLEKSGVIRFGRTISFTPGLSRPGINNFQSATFDIPAGLKPGVYNATVIVNGIKSTPAKPITVVEAKVTATFANGVLTIVGDAESNNIQVTYKQVKVSGVLKSASVTITAGDAFTTINGASTVTLNPGIQRFVTNVNMGAGDDVVSFNGLFLNSMTCNLGDGNDTSTFLYNSILGQLTLDGGIGVDTATLTGNSIGKLVRTNIP
jgi:hypothetical protein